MGLIGVAAAAGVMWMVERWRPGRAWPAVPGWLVRAAQLNAVQVAIVFAAGAFWDDWMRANRPWSADRLGAIGGAALGYLAITLVYYFWHRARHAQPWLWRVFHQIHHSPRRLEVITSFYKHPAEIALNGVLSSAILYLMVGLSAPVAATVVALTGLAELFYHWNVRTPHWLGFVFQRPETHCVHHARGRHRSNYSDLPIWDLLFGTFDNPRRFDGACGFSDGREERLAEMLLGRDVHAGGKEAA